MTHTQRRHQAFGRLPRQDRHVLASRELAAEAERRRVAAARWDRSPLPAPTPDLAENELRWLYGDR